MSRAQVLSGAVVRNPTGSVSARIDLRAAAVTLVLVLLALAIALHSLASGDFEIPLPDVVRTLLGQETGGAKFIVLDLRLPRTLTALLVGAALGVSGAIFQSLTRNPLGSPDFIGLTIGASTGALLVILVLNGSTNQIALGALLGCAATAVAIYLLAYRRGAQSFRLILVGIGIGAMLDAFNSFLITRARLDEAVGAQVWLIGTLNGRSWDQVRPLLLAVIVLLPLAFWQSRHLNMLSLGDETATALGVPVERTRGLLFACAVALAAVATSAAGPIAFVALAAPQLAIRVTRSAGSGLASSAAMGALLLVASDWVAQRALPSGPVPVGIATGLLGGAYLCWLLVHEWRKGR
ncbi:FecCD family ABC transporter permease [Kineosporia babensis]|uniref:Iron chelate uptake ABC transporter family permease subunit n=1 Tax=Kineosporia babensis TaxID=499548 RepID=A0A9X1NAP2_9ACTN|nr:iron chelate uptake ABC transporter family permease subunit [Kineosporia babensis]